MANWIKVAGFYYMQSSGPIDYEENRKVLVEVDLKLQEAEVKFGLIRREQSA